jgi:hypothetical protein
MPQPRDDPGERGPGYTKAAGFGPHGQHPRTRPPVTPPQFQQDTAPPRQDPRPTPQYTQAQLPQPAFTPGPWQASQAPGGQYPPPRPAWQQPYQPRYAPGPLPRRKRHTARNVLAGTGALIGVIIVISVAANSGRTTQTTGSAGAAGGTQVQAAAPANSGPAGTTSELQALAAAQNYLSDGQGFSRQGLIDQLDSPAGDNFSVADATWAAGHSGANWDDQAVDSAKNYMSDGEGFSRDGLIQQMTSAEGDQFTQAQATYAANAVGL